MTHKQAALEFLRQQYPKWVLGGTMNSVWVEKDGERVTSGFRGDRNCRQMAKDGIIARAENEDGYAIYQWKPPAMKESKLLTDLRSIKKANVKTIQSRLI